MGKVEDGEKEEEGRVEKPSPQQQPPPPPPPPPPLCPSLRLKPQCLEERKVMAKVVERTATINKQQGREESLGTGQYYLGRQKARKKRDITTTAAAAAVVVAGGNANGERREVNEKDNRRRTGRRRLVASRRSQELGTKLGQFAVDVLITTLTAAQKALDIHWVTNGNVAEGLDVMLDMLNNNYIQIEVWVNITKFLTHLGPTEGYLSEDQFMVYGSSRDVLDIVMKITTWYYVVLDTVASLEELAEALEEGSVALLLRPSSADPSILAVYTLLSPGGGTKVFKYVGRWVEGRGLVVAPEIFPRRSYNFRGRVLDIAVISVSTFLVVGRA
ncbi:hypothetical protein Pmani_013950 [Petrolisthes manimaculis]|uniref:Uncharacterized protein n=1 Tax=Petrolisthes manimaculis TaxID=1843537 RepID=A0AAE1PUY2_9EUCA|nr:hypothetical protein Pmani_013950 [Petrolisthes manimaculis]